MNGSPLKKTILPAIVLSAAVFGTLTMPLALFGSKPVTIELEGEPLFYGQLRDVATPYLGLASLLSVGAGVASVAIAGWQSCGRKSSEIEVQISRVAHNLKKKEQLLDILQQSQKAIAHDDQPLTEEVTSPPHESLSPVEPPNLEQPSVDRSSPIPNAPPNRKDSGQSNLPHTAPWYHSTAMPNQASYQAYTNTDSRLPWEEQLSPPQAQPTDRAKRDEVYPPSTSKQHNDQTIQPIPRETNPTQNGFKNAPFVPIRPAQGWESKLSSSSLANQNPNPPQPNKPPQVTTQAAAANFASAQTFLGFTYKKATVEPSQESANLNSVPNEVQVTSPEPEEVGKLYNQIQQVMEQMQSLQKALSSHQLPGDHNTTNTN